MNPSRLDDDDDDVSTRSLFWHSQVTTLHNNAERNTQKTTLYAVKDREREDFVRGEKKGEKKTFFFFVMSHCVV